MTQPLFVLGKQRSGTTWLSTQLSQHSQIACVRDDHHGGIEESAYFSHVAGRYGDLSKKTNYVEFVEVVAVSDFMGILGVDKDFLYALWPTTYEGVFEAVMTRLAQQKGSRYWLDKTPEHTLMADKLAALYPDAKFVAILRDAHDVMRSSMGRYGDKTLRHRRYLLARGTLNLAHHNQEIRHFARRSSERVHVVQFANMKHDAEGVFRDICRFLELDFEPALLEEAYRPNTTFIRGRERNRVLSEGDKRIVDLTMSVSKHLPVQVFRAVKRVAEFRKEKTLPRWFFSMYPPVFEKQSHSE